MAAYGPAPVRTDRILRVSPTNGKSSITRYEEMKVLRSLKSAKKRHKDCRVIRRRGRIYVINKTNRRFKARQG